MKDNETVIALLQDIKKMLYGIVLLLVASALVLAGFLLPGFPALGIGLAVGGICVFVAGFGYINQGYHNNPPKSEEKKS